jgi:hypothetical protein
MKYKLPKKATVTALVDFAVEDADYEVAPLLFLAGEGIGINGLVINEGNETFYWIGFYGEIRTKPLPLGLIAIA